ncbi:hypothetical protein [Thalassotalea sp. G2M2-11]|uniref:hypothetical protein n=1 Tax=Thalassotalea sp. G2M2-11 TaxID=2787627 RepID=UPI0019D12777|nr:hypothetical protein [Thalassotalea sp. G2M2-11]
MTPCNRQTLNDNWAQVGIPKALLDELISTGVLTGDQCRCLNSIAKNVMWESLLNTSVKVV